MVVVPADDDSVSDLSTDLDGKTLWATEAGPFKEFPARPLHDIVGDLLRVHARRPSVPQALLVMQAKEIAVALGDPVVGQELALELAREFRLEVAHLGPQLLAALGEDLGRGRRVHVLGDVPVVLQRSLEAALAGSAEGRREKAALALVVERERDVRRVQDRHPEEEDGGVVGIADVARAVDVELAHADEPVVARRHAGGVLGVEEPALLVFLEDRARCLAARGRAAVDLLGKLEHRRLHLARVVVEAIRELRPGRSVAVAIEAHVADRHRLLVVDEVLDPVGADRGSVLAQHDVAGRDDAAVLLALDVVGLEELGAVALRARRGEPQLLLDPEPQALGNLRPDAGRGEGAGERDGQRASAATDQGSARTNARIDGEG